MTIDYNRGHIAEQYQQAKQQPWRPRVEAYSLMKRIGDLAGRRVVDIACGEGHFTRRLRLAGAADVLGVDISERMVELAREQEAAQPLGISYSVSDAREPTGRPEFDLAVSAWLLVYARSREELSRMCRGVASWLRPGGRFVTFTTNPDVYHFHPRADYSRYGFTIDLADEATDGAPILWKIPVGSEMLEIDNYYLPVSAYREAFEAAGFHSFQVHAPELSPPPDGQDDAEYWSPFLTQPPAVVMKCVKAGG